MSPDWCPREAFVCDALDVVKIKVVYPEGAIVSERDAASYRPPLVHQVFGTGWVSTVNLPIVACSICLQIKSFILFLFHNVYTLFIKLYGVWMTL